MSKQMLQPDYFDQEEQQLMEAIERDEFVSVAANESQLSLLQQAAEASLREREVKEITFFKRDLQRIRVIAAQKGLPYQALISAIVHQYANGQLKEV
jgi:predicted DNA binding CopG/RHH family protein